jgi:hypothetical protein
MATMGDTSDTIAVTAVPIGGGIAGAVVAIVDTGGGNGGDVAVEGVGDAAGEEGGSGEEVVGTGAATTRASRRKSVPDFR